VLYQLLVPLSSEYSWLNIFRYITFRAALAFFIAFTFVLIVQPIFIRFLQRVGHRGQPIREDGPKTHEVKKGTPTMGGLVVVAAIALSVLLLCDLKNPFIWQILFVMVSFAALGFLDDARKVFFQNPKGVSGPMKLIWQTATSLLIGLGLYYIGFPTDVHLPFVKDVAINLGILFIPFVMFVIVGTSNAVNLTDGLDGLAIGPVMTVAVTYAIFCYVGGREDFASYLAIPHISGVGELTILLSAVFAAGLGFLWYNTFPAQVFMGDIGALALGGVLGLSAILVKHELVLVIAGGIFVMEATSVIIQRYYYKLTKKRVFRMAPIHHHFELNGWAEPKIIVRFWIISIVLAFVSLTTLKLR
jgi:phospho-N-acetylmuramoyl-pentapeptide-transferase